MAVRIRLTRVGATKRPAYRVVAIDRRRSRDGRALEILGYYDPLTDPATVNLDTEKINAWIRNGAQPSDTVARLIRLASQPATEAKPKPKPKPSAKAKAKAARADAGAAAPVADAPQEPAAAGETAEETAPQAAAEEAAETPPVEAAPEPTDATDAPADAEPADAEGEAERSES